MNKSFKKFGVLFLSFFLTLVIHFPNGWNSIMNAQTTQPQWVSESTARLENELTLKYGEAQKPRLLKGMQQVLNLWRPEDGEAKDFEEFVRTHFAGDQTVLDEMFYRYEKLLEKLDGHMNEIALTFRWHTDLDLGTIYPFDKIFSAYEPAAHIRDDFFKNKLAFIVLLNFPLSTLDQRLTEGKNWTRRQWAETKLAQRFSKRIPAEVSQTVAEAAADAEHYIAQYNIWMHHIIDQNGQRLFPPKLRLLSHWNLRDEIKASYNDQKNGIKKQRMIQKIMERIITQSIPAVVINNPHVDWDPYSNQVKPTDVIDSDDSAPTDMPITNDPEPDIRYATWLKTFHASRKVDAYSPTAPTLIDRRFNEDRQIPEARVKNMLEQVVSSPLVNKVARLIEKRLGRRLEPFDIWYNGFKPRGSYTEEQLDEMVKQKYPTAEAFEKDIPNILEQLKFPKERAKYIAEYIAVDPARGSGHAWGAAMRYAKARLRTRIGKTGMNYKGFNIAIHELGHNVEQVLSLNDIDYTLLQGVPNTAFTEAIAFVFQAKDLELLNVASHDEKSKALKTLGTFWQTYEIAGVALLDMAVWNWLYNNPNASAVQLKDAVIKIAKDIWNKYYAPVFKQKDVILLAIYSHLIQSFLYTPDYPLGHLIAFQIEEQMRKSESIGVEVERITKVGSIAPDLWMINATGSPVGAEALLTATERALKEIK